MSSLWSDSNNAMALTHQPRPPELPPVGSFPRGRPASSQVATRGSFDRKQSNNRPGTSGTVGGSDYTFLPGVPQTRPMTSSTAMSQDLGGRTDTSLIFGEPHGVPHMRGVHTSQSALERDAANHWKKWGCGGKGPADMLVHLAEELKHCCWEEDERCFPDKRMERIHEQMIHISQRLIRQPPKGPDLPQQLPAIEKKEPPPSVLMSENTRLRQELKEAKDMADALETTVTNYVTFKSKTKAREKWMRGYALDGRFLAYDVATAKTACGAWSKAILGQRNIRKVREYGAELMKYHQDLGLLSVCLSLWEANHRVVITRELVSETLRTWMHRHKSDILVFPIFIAWSHQVTQMILERERDQAAKDKIVAEEKMRFEKKRLMDKFGEVAMAQLRKVINADEETVLQITLQNWTQMIQMIHQERKDEQARLEAEKRAEEARQARLARAEALFFKHGRALRGNVWSAWFQQVERAAIARRMLENNRNMTLKRIMGSEEKLKQAIITGWLDACRDDIQARQRAELKAAQDLLAKARRRTLTMLGKRDSQEEESVKALAFAEWFRIMDSAKQLRKRKDGNIARAMKNLMTKDAAILEKVFKPWKEHYQKRKAHDQRLDQVSKSLGLQKNELLRDAMGLWFKSTVEDLRKRQEELRKREAEAWKEFMRQQQLKACEKCFGRKAGELVKQVWKGWLAIVDDTKCKTDLIDRGMKHAMKMIMGDQLTMKRTIISLWIEATRADEVQRRKHEMELARRIIARARENIMKALNNKIGQDKKAMITNSFQGWKKDAKETKITRRRKEAAMKNGVRLAARIQEELLRMVMPSWLEIHKIKKARDKRIDSIERSLGMSKKGMAGKFLMQWVKFAASEKKERLEAEAKAKIEAEAARKLALEKRRLQIADRWYWRIKRHQQEAIWNFWISEVEAMKEAGRKYEENMSKATRLIMGSEAALQVEVFTMWKDLFHDECQIRLQMKLADAELGMKLVQAARERAMQMFRKNLHNGVLALKHAVLVGWIEQMEIARVRMARDDIVMKNVMMHITNAEIMYTWMAVGSWAKIAQDAKGLGKLRREAETAVRRTFLGLCQGVIMRMHKRVAVSHCWDAWALRALG